MLGRIEGGVLYQTTFAGFLIKLRVQSGAIA